MRAIQSIFVFLLFLIFDEAFGRKRTIEDLMRSRPTRFNKKIDLTKREKAILDLVNSQKNHYYSMQQAHAQKRRSATN